MWIAKPLDRLSADERALWAKFLDYRKQTDDEVPLSQTLIWGSAIQAMGGKVFAVFSPDENVGGLVVKLEDDMECINGPLLDWENEDDILRQIATFTHAIEKCGEVFATIKLNPRWMKRYEAAFFDHVQMEPAQVQYASTYWVPLHETDEEQKAALSPRIKRSLATAEKEGMTVEWKSIDVTDASLLSAIFKKFGEEKGFYIPPQKWFEALVASVNSKSMEKVELGWVVAKYKHPDFGSATTHLLIGVFQGVAHYLFGAEIRDEKVPSKISPSTSAHFFAMRTVHARGAWLYDFNGYVENIESGHVYKNVNDFKSRWGGQVIPYSSPEYIFET